MKKINPPVQQPEMKPLTESTVLQPNDRIAVPVMILPGFRSQIAINRGVERNLLIKTWGGIGDQICAEPTLRYALREFDDADVSLATMMPRMFKHLKFKRVFDMNDTETYPAWDKYFVFETIVNSDDIVWQFFSHCLVNCVDFPSLCAFRCMMPIEDKEIYLTPDEPKDSELIRLVEDERYVFVHAGKHWPSKTFPKDWWDDVLQELINFGYTPVLIGADADDNRGTVDVDSEFCIDLRNKTTLEELAWLLQRARVLLTNDSSPLHIAASRNPFDESTGRTWIGYIATCKHPDYITHWRRDDNGKMQFAWREENLGLGGMWETLSHCPNNKEEVKVDQVDEETLRSWLPEPKSVAQWVEDRNASKL